MKWFYDLSFRNKLVLPVGLLALVILVNAVVGMQLNEQLAKQAFHLADDSLPSIDLLLQADRDIYQAQVAERSLIFRDPKSDDYRAFAKMHDENIDQAIDRTNRFFGTTRVDAARAKKKEFLDLFETWRKTSQQIELLSKESEKADQAVALSYGDAQQQFDAMRQVIDRLTLLVEDDAETAAHSVHSIVDRAHTIQAVSLGVGLAICFLVLFFLPRLTVRPLHRVISAIDELASGDGDLTLRVNVDSKDELGSLAGSLNLFMDKLQTLIRGLSGTANQVGGHAGKLQGLSSETNATITEQHVSIDQVATAITEMAATVQEIAKSASHAADAARDADASAQKGSERVNLSADSIRNLAEDIEQAATVVYALQKETSEVGAVIDVIREIAEQTNLLALNAAIEAARAGEQGRGFAVVADEVRTLASRTKQSTSEIQEMVERLQGWAEEAVSVMDTGKEKTQKSVELAEQADHSLIEITQAVSSISSMNTQIASASVEQEAVTEEINRNVNNIGHLSTCSLNNAGQTAEASTALQDSSKDLMRIVGHFQA